ncbi:MAG: 2,3-bisphosphoglycerate-independent phosphoglycerate mutase [Myxococcota bacterium]|nr:2,3-bisphosphoglycerate-independent phosphoglycerate mutase [Myxococcota bacterium]
MAASHLSLSRHPSFSGVKGPVVVVVMDGVGVGQHDEGDAVHLARTPSLDWLAANAPHRTLRAHGTAVGLPSDDDMGNSEVGHNALGAGRIFDQGAKLVNAAIDSRRLFEGEAWKQAVRTVKASGEPLHFLGLLSDGNVHSHVDHLFAMMRRAAADGVAKVRVHVLLDGRDVPETSALLYADMLEKELGALSTGGRDYRVASGGGRMKNTMDRYAADWPMVERGWKLHVRGEGRAFGSLHEAIESLRAEQPGVIDQNLPGFVIAEKDGAPVGPVRDGAAVILFNFRGDRAIEITRAFEEEHFDAFDRGPRPNVFFAGMMQYDGDLQMPRHFLVAPPEIDRTLSIYLAGAGVTQLAISETQKFGHVTYFWNGNRSEKLAGETWIEVPSDTRPFEERPWMKAAEITDRLIDQLRTGEHRHARVNYANGDMIGHTGVREAAILAVESVDLQIGRLLPVIRELGGALLITADHGNADEMYERDKKSGAVQRDAAGRPRAKTSHTLNPVPCYLYAPANPEVRFAAGADDGGLANVAATVLALLGFAAPDFYLPALITTAAKTKSAPEQAATER